MHGQWAVMGSGDSDGSISHRPSITAIFRMITHQVEDQVQQVLQEVLGLPGSAGGDDGVGLQGVPVRLGGEMGGQQQ